jgi:hypothetical protein
VSKPSLHKILDSKTLLIRGCLHDEDDYPAPEVFNPDRFIEGPQRCPDPRDLAFGVGRRLVLFVYSAVRAEVSILRICPGRHFAQSTLWINSAMMLYLFDISKPSNAEEPSLDYEMSAGVRLVHSSRQTRHFSLSPLLFNSHPRPFKCNFRLRSKRRSELLSDSLARLA